MKNEPWIDQVYVDKFDNRKIPMDLNHWKQAEAMIIAEENKEKKKRFIFWLGGVGVLVLLGLSAWGFYTFHRPNTTGKPETAPELPVSPVRSEQPIASDDINRSDDLKLKNAIATNSSTVDPTVGRVEILKSHLLNDHTAGLNGILSAQVNVKSNKAQQSHSDLTKETNNLETDYTNGVPSSKYSTKDNSAPNVQTQFIDLVRLDPKKSAIPDFVRTLQLPSEQMDIPIVLKKVRWKEQGIRMSLANEAGINTAATSISQVGLAWYRQHNLRKNLMYGYGVGYTSNFNRTQYAQVLTSYEFNGFGSKINNYGVKPEWIHQVNAEFNLGAQWLKHRFLSGLKPEFVMGAKGKVDQIRFKDASGIKDLALAEVSSLEQGWLQNKVFNPLSLTVYFGYEYRILERIGVGVQVSHTLVSPYRSLDFGIKQSPGAAWNTGFRFSYLLN